MHLISSTFIPNYQSPVEDWESWRSLMSRGVLYIYVTGHFWLRVKWVKSDFGETSAIQRNKGRKSKNVVCNCQTVTTVTSVTSGHLWSPLLEVARGVRLFCEKDVHARENVRSIMKDYSVNITTRLRDSLPLTDMFISVAVCHTYIG